MSASQRLDVADGGVLIYHPHFFSTEQADELCTLLKSLTPWRQEIGVFGHPFPRLTSYYADPGVSYRYSGVTHHALPWPEHLLDVRARVEQMAEAPFNSLLLNYYRDGKDSMGYHSDAEPELGLDPIVPSISLGATRRFLLRHLRTKELLTFDLTHGSLLIMAGTTQHHWLHSVPKTTKPVGERINLTFRNIISADT